MATRDLMKQEKGTAVVVSMIEGSAKKLGLENDLHKAIEGPDFLLYYQPKVGCLSKELVGIEALLRWQHPIKGVLEPSRFIQMAEETGLILPIGGWVLETACRQNIAWQKAGFPHVRIAINVSSLQLRQEDFLHTIFDVLDKTGLDPRLLELEIAESTIMQNEVEAREKLSELKSVGIKLSIDDFSIGYSSFSYLKRLSVDCLKIDRSFVRGVTEDPDDRAITRAIIAMAHSLGLSVVAEGVETRQQLEFLQQQGCDEIQGWYFSRAISAEQLRRFFSGLPHSPQTSSRLLGLLGESRRGVA